VLKTTGRNAVVTSPIEHKAVLASVHKAAAEGAEERMLTVDATGTVTMDSAHALVRDDTALCSVMWVNNEIGTIQPIEALANHCHTVGAIFHTDAVQAFGKVEVDARKIPFDFLSISGHKIGAPKGSGAMFIRRGTPLEPLFFGGSQDRGRRPGTENVAYAVALATAAELIIAEHDAEGARLGKLRDRLQAGIVAAIPDTVVHGRDAKRATHVLNVSIPGTDSESMLMALDLQGVSASGGSACQSGSIEPSHVLRALGVRADIAGAAIRMSVGSLTTDAAIDRVIHVFSALALKARGLSAV